MSLADKLKLHFADQHAVWSGTWPRAIAGATFDDATGARHLILAVESPVVAARIVDAYVQGLEDGAQVTVAFEGEMTAVARQAAERLGVQLLDAAPLPFPVPEPVLALPPHVEGPAPPPAIVPDAPLALEPGAPLLDETLLHEVDDLVATLADEPLLPWHGPAAPEPEPARVDPMEVLAMPWHHPDHARPDEHMDILPGNARSVSPLFRPTQAPDWGLPWPRPVPPADALALSDPTIWKARERTMAVHGDLSNAWLRRVQQGP